MKTLVIVLVVIAVAAASFYGYYGIALGKPTIKITPSSYDFGLVSEKVSHEFTVENLGNLPLEINRVSTSCGCTTASIDSDVILPGQSANLVVSYDPNAMEVSEEDIFRIVYVKSNDPENPEVEVEITAKVALQ